MLITAIYVRRCLRKVVVREFPALQALSFLEIGEDTELRVIGNIDLIGGELTSCPPRIATGLTDTLESFKMT